MSIKKKQELVRIVQRAALERSTNSTTMNETSSRSHAVLEIFIETQYKEEVEEDGREGPRKVRKRHHTKSLMTLVDLAGSERVSKSGSSGMRLEEAKNINKSISALGNVVSALAKR